MKNLRSFLRRIFFFGLALLFVWYYFTGKAECEYSLSGFSAEEQLFVKTRAGTDVPVYNFFLYPETGRGNASGTYFILKYTPRYTITYTISDNSFVLLLDGQDLNAARVEAEQVLLEKLRVSRDTVCALDVKVTTFYVIKGNPAGVDYGLTFCPNSKPFKN